MNTTSTNPPEETADGAGGGPSGGANGTNGGDASGGACGTNGDDFPEITPRIAAALWLGLILIFALAIRHYRIAEPFGGYHAFNEGWYSVIARNYESHGLLNPISILGKPDYNVAPFHSQILYFVRQLFGESEAHYRMVSIVFSLLSVYFVFLIGNRLFSSSAGLIAAALLAFTPVGVVAGRNVQTDSTYLAILLASLYCYILADTGNKTWRMALSGLLFGLAFYSKQFAILLIPSLLLWECARNRGLRWVSRRHIVFAVCAAVVPAPYFIYHLSASAGQIFKAQSGLSGSQFVIAGLSEWKYILGEYFWGYSPAICALFAAAALAALLRRGSHRWLLLINILVFAAFFSFWHGHSYYILHAAPFAALLAGELLARRLKDGWNMLIVLLVCSLAAVQTVAFLCNVKYERTSFLELSKALNRGAGFTLILSHGIEGNYRPTLQYYLPRAKIVTEKVLSRRLGRDLRFLEGQKIVVVSYAGRPASDFPSKTTTIYNRTVVLYLFGRIVYLRHESEFFFKAQKFDVRRHGPPWRTGVFPISYKPDIVIAPLPPGARYATEDGRLKYYVGGK